MGRVTSSGVDGLDKITFSGVFCLVDFLLNDSLIHLCFYWVLSYELVENLTRIFKEQFNQ